MATEVTCGQCHGRLLIETPGVVVACPHCGVHLSIPALATEPTTQPDPLAERDTAIETPPTSGSPPVNDAADDPGDIELNLNPAELAAAPPHEPATDPLNSSSVFGGPDEQDHAAEAGWHSAPNLFLAQSESSPPSGPVETGLFTSPLMDRTHDPVSDSVTSQALAMFQAFGEAPQSPDPAWNFAPGEAATAVPDELLLSASQQFTLGAPAEESPDVPESPFSFGLSTDSSGIAAPASLPEAASARTLALPGEGIEDLALSSSQQFSLGQAADTIAAVETGAGDSIPIGEVPSGSSVPAAPIVPTPVEVPAGAAVAAAQQKVLILLLLMVGSYASAVTIEMIYLLVVGRTHQLESLPDLKPPMKNGEVTVTGYISPVNDLPAGHVLRLGQSQRFGSVRVTPVKVTRGTVKFEHVSGKSALELTDTEPLLKLWLKFENVSQDQTFSPLDPLLVFKRSKQSRGVKVSAHNFLSTVANRKQAKSIFRVYDLPLDLDFAMVGQKLDTRLSPGETWQSFVPSEEVAVELQGDLVWRVHIRKGYHPASRRGVTTLIDVQFNSSDISNDS